jgi:hypothetical protein
MLLSCISGVAHSNLSRVTVYDNYVFLRVGVHAPTKSVLVLAAILVVLIFHVTLWPGSTRGRQDKVIGTTTNMSATPSINTPAWCAEQVSTCLPGDVASLEKIRACSFVCSIVFWRLWRRQVLAFLCIV